MRGCLARMARCQKGSLLVYFDCEAALARGVDMSTIVIKNVPDEIHARLKERAQQNRRSLTKELLTIIEQNLPPVRAAPRLPPPVKLKGGPLTIEELEAAIASGRE